MKKNRFLQRAVFLTFLSLVLLSCGASLETGMRQVKLDMSRQEVVNKLGNDFIVVSMAKTDQGYLEILRYTTYTTDTSGPINKLVPYYYYYLHFLNGKLVEMNQEDAVPPVIVRPPHRHP